ncbi:MAG: DUF4870 domain-containing protein [Chthoniobacterales bacterium]
MDTPPPLNRPENSKPTIEMVPASSSESAHSWCIGLHLSGLSGLILSFALAHIVVPLVIWLVKRADSPEIDSTGKEVLNFQITYTIYSLIAGALCFVLIGFLILPIVLIVWLVCIIIAAVKTSNGETYRYPATIRFLQ